MPKVVDAQERRAAIAAAVWRVIRREGLERASVRNVAAEAGLSMGSLRHYFGSQAELLRFSMEVVVERVDARVRAALVRPGDARERAERALAELLPLDDERRAEAEVWLAFVARAQVEPPLRDLLDRADQALRRLCQELVRAMAAEGLAARGLDPRLEGERLYALIDGMALHRVIDHADRLPPRLMRAVVARHLDSLGA